MKETVSNGTKRRVFETEIGRTKSWKCGAITQVRGNLQKLSFTVLWPKESVCNSPFHIPLRAHAQKKAALKGRL